MDEVSARMLEIEAAFDEIDAVWGHDPKDIPEWIAQELTFAQTRLLFLLDRNGPSPVSRVAEWFGVGLPAASGIVDRVERHGLVSRQHRLDDRRVVECRLTDKGCQLLDEIGGIQRGRIRHLLGVLTEEELADFARLMKTVRDRVKEQTQRTQSPGAESPPVGEKPGPTDQALPTPPIAASRRPS
jgi:DNA-binding MarR family transcriptional regulator